MKLPEEEEDALPGAEPATPTVEDLSARLAGARVTGIAVAETGQEAVAATAAGSFLPMSVDSEGTITPAELVTVEPQDPSPVTAVAFLLGGQSVVFGDEKGRVSSWFRVRSPENPSLRLFRKIHVFDPMPAAVTAIGISTRNKGFVTADAKGDIWLRHNTSEQTLLRFSGRGAPAVAAGLSGLGDSLYELTADGRLATWSISNPHPETTLKTLFGKVWYEGYDRPEYSWQSTGATDDFEPKFSLTPLIFGTLKATVYALLFAIPVALGAALYAAVFAAPAVRRLVKPVVEIMAALPSVVIGFLAGLWLAPLVERTTVGTLLLAPMVPLVDRRGGPGLPGAAARDAHAVRPAAGDAPAHRGRSRGRLARFPARSLVRADGLRRGLQELALRELAGPVRPAQLDHHRLRDGVRGHPDHLHDQRGRVLERPGPPLRGEPRARGLALADGDARRSSRRRRPASSRR